MDQRDQTFLHDVANLTSMNRIVAVHALQQAWANADASAVWAVAALHSHRHADQLTPEVLKAVREQQMVPEDTFRVQRTLLAKLFVEVMSGYEDLAALCLAIRQHNREQAKRAKVKTQQPVKGIFRRFLDSQTREVKAYVYCVHQLKIPQQAGITIEHQDLLAAPPRSGFPAAMPADKAAAVKQYYEDLPQNLHQVFDQYIQADSSLRSPQQQMHGLLPGWEQDLNILMDVLPRGQVPRSEVAIRAFNKLKHRFMITEHLDQFDTAGGPGVAAPTQIEYARLPVNDAFVKMLVQNAVSTSMAMSSIARMLIVMNEAGIPM